VSQSLPVPMLLPCEAGEGTMRSMVEGACGAGRRPLRLAALATSPARGGGTIVQLIDV
jgi:hypothetical protein